MLAATSSVHAGVLAELVEWWEDVADGGKGSQVLLWPAPPGWGVSTLLERLAAQVGGDPLTAGVLSIASADAVGLSAGGQAEWLAQRVKAAGLVTERPRLDWWRSRLGLDRGEGIAERAVGAGGLLVSWSPFQIAGFLADLGLEALSVTRDDARNRPAALTRQLAELVARNSTGTPVLVVLDDADLLDQNVAVALIRGLVERTHGRVLIAAVCHPADSPVARTLRRLDQEHYLPGRIHYLDVDSRTDYPARQALVDELTPNWPQAPRVQLATKTHDLGEVFRVLALDGADDIPHLTTDAERRETVDQFLASTHHDDDQAPWPARVVAWAGGLIHRDQLTAVLEAIDLPSEVDDTVTTVGNWVRLAQPSRLEHLAASTTGILDHHHNDPRDVIARHATRVVVTTADPLTRIAALRPVHHLATRPHASFRDSDAEIIATLARELADLGDDERAVAAAQNAIEAAYEANDDRLFDTADTLLLDLSQRQPQIKGQARVLADQIHRSLDTTTISLETRIWAAVVRLNNPQTHTQATTEAETLGHELDNIESPTANWWRLLLAFHAGNTGHPDIAHQLLQPLLTAKVDEPTRQLAEWTLYAIGGSQADLRLYLAALEHNQPPADAHPEEHLRHAAALAHTNDKLGRYEQARRYAEYELELRRTLYPTNHPSILTTRADLAHWTGLAGYYEHARQLYDDLLPDIARVFGLDHQYTITTRANLADSTGRAGHPERSRRLLADLLPDMTRILGPDHRNTLTTRYNLAERTGIVGHPDDARQLYAELLPDMTRVLGPDHHYTLNTRAALAQWTGDAGQPEAARQILVDLFPDTTRVLGPNHPDTLTARDSLARWTGDAGHPDDARQLYAELIPDMTRVLGPDHPKTLGARAGLGYWSGEAGHPKQARQLLADVLSDQIRVLRADHPDTLTTRHNLAHWTYLAGRPEQARQILIELLPDLSRVLGTAHPKTTTTREKLAQLALRATDGR